MNISDSVLSRLDAFLERRADFVVAQGKTRQLLRTVEARSADSLEVKTRQLEIETSL